MFFRNLFLILLLSLTLPVSAQQALNARIEKSWTVNETRQESVNGIDRSIDLSSESPFDLLYSENTLVLFCSIHEGYSDRKITGLKQIGGTTKLPFDYYEVLYYEENKLFIYTMYGTLVGYCSPENVCYNTKGKLIDKKVILSQNVKLDMRATEYSNSRHKMTEADRHLLEKYKDFD